MKKSIIVAFLIGILMMMAYPAKCETKLTVSGKIEMGANIESYQKGNYDTFLDVELGLNLYVDWFKWEVYVGSRTWFELGFPSDKLITGYPFREIYFYGTRFNFNGFFIGLEHFCNHAVSSGSLHWSEYEAKEKFYTNKWWSNVWGETMTTISVGYKFELPVWTKN